MKPTIEITVRLTTDAEPGTGLGGETANSVVPRNAKLERILNASHLKGLMRHSLSELIARRGWDQNLQDCIFGCSDSEDPNAESAIELFTATDVRDGTVKNVTRTAISKRGVGKDQTLRTTESIASETEFRGKIGFRRALHAVEDLAWRLALLSIPAVGSNRNRGSGRCEMSIAGESRSPGELLVALDQALRSAPDWSSEVHEQADENPAKKIDVDSKLVIARLVYVAESPTALPEHPDRSNVITTGFSVSASAVQGILLTRLSKGSRTAADSLFELPTFRTWPLQPCWYNDDLSLVPKSKDLPWSTRVSLTHQAGKYSIGENYDFRDRAVDWREDRADAPLKASDGVLLKPAVGGAPVLWTARTMPHVLTSHGVRFPERNLFSVDSMAPMVWSGMVMLPMSVARVLEDSFRSDPNVSVGKSRTVRGHGQLRFEILDEGTMPPVWETHTDSTVLVIQSPIYMGRQPSQQSSEVEFRSRAEQWVSDFSLPPVEKTWARTDILFGWNRSQHAGDGGGFQGACRVVSPGAVVALKEKVSASKLFEMYASGRFETTLRERGFGAVTVHPGIAHGMATETRYVSDSTARELTENSDLKVAMQRILKLDKRISKEGTSLPSVSQIRAVQQRLEQPVAEEERKSLALEYLDRQVNDRTTNVWANWDEAYGDITKVIEKHPPKIASRALECLADLSRISQSKLASQS